MKKNIWLIMLLVFVLLVSACAPKATETAVEEPVAEEQPVEEAEMEVFRGRCGDAECDQ